MHDRLFIGIDSGTQGTKGVLLSEKQGRIIAESYFGYEMSENSRGGREQDPDIWIKACKNVLRDLLATPTIKRKDLLGIGVSAQQHGCVVLDKDDKVVRPAKLWCDTETVSQCLTITEQTGGYDKVRNLIGNQIAAGFTASKILWIKENEPKKYNTINSILLPHDYINFWLTGEKTTEAGDASGTAYFDVHNRCWSEDILQSIDPERKLSDCLPKLIQSEDPSGLLTPALAKEFDVSPTVIVSSGGGDNMMAAIGTGNVQEGIITASLGTSGTIYAYSDKPVIDKKDEVSAFCSSSGGWLPLVCTMNVTVATELFRKLFDIDVQEMNDLISAVPLGSKGLILIPYFNGERTPALPHASASLTGMTSQNMTQATLCRSAMEGVTFGLRYGFEALRRNGIQAEEIRLVGGGAKSPIWRQMVADIFNCSVVTITEEEAGALGAALQAFWCYLRQKESNVTLKEITDSYVMPDNMPYEPNTEAVSFYSEIYDTYLKRSNTLHSVESVQF